jgi:hypothetical protein
LVLAVLVLQQALLLAEAEQIQHLAWSQLQPLEVVVEALTALVLELVLLVALEAVVQVIQEQQVALAHLVKVTLVVAVTLFPKTLHWVAEAVEQVLLVITQILVATMLVVMVALG